MNSIAVLYSAKSSRLSVRRLAALLAVITFCGFAQQTIAVGLFWSGDGANEGGTGTWDTNNAHFGTSAGGPFSTIWTNANTDDATFEATVGTVTIGASGITLNGTLTDNSGYTFSGSTLTLGGTSAINIAAGIITTNSTVLAGGPLVKNGPGTLQLGLAGSSVNTYTSNTVLNAGTLALGAGNGANLGANGTGNHLVIANDGVTILQRSTTGRSPQAGVDQLGDLILDNGALGVSANVQFTLAQGFWKVSGNRKITAVANTGIGVFIIGNGTGGTTVNRITEYSGPASLTFDGGGVVTIQAENDITGGVTVSGGTVRVPATIVNPFGISAASLTLAGGEVATTADRGTLPIANPVSVTADSSIATSSGAATVGFVFTNTFASVSGKTLTFIGNTTAGQAFNPRLSGGFAYNGKIAIANNGGPTTLNLFNTTTNDQTFIDVISGTGAISRSASSAGTGGTTIMNAANTYAGGTTLNDGAITLGVDSSGTPPTITSGPIGTGTLTVSPGVNGAPKLFSPNGGTLGNAINLANTTAPLVVSNGDTFTMLGLITGSGRISKTGLGQLRVSPTGGSSTYSGGTSNVSGEIAFDGNSSGSGDTPTSGAAGVGPIYAFSGCAFSPLSRSRTVANTLLFRGTSCTINGGSNLTFTGSVDLGGNNVAITVNNSGTNALIFNGALTNGGLTKGGLSTIMLNGTSTYTGPTAVNAGSLIVNGALGATAVTVSSSGTLGGNGTIAGSVTVNGGGIISAGRSAGELTVNNNLDLSAGGTNIWELTANSAINAGTDFDQIAMTSGNLVLGGSSHLLIKFIGPATVPDNVTTFWQSSHSWTNIALSGTAANPGSSNFSTIDGTNGITSGTFTTSVDGSGSLILTYSPAGSVPQPVIGPIVGAGTANAQISWSSVSGAHYTVQYKTNLSDANWSSLTGLTASGSSTTITDNTTPIAAQKFYRVISP